MKRYSWRADMEINLKIHILIRKVLKSFERGNALTLEFFPVRKCKLSNFSVTQIEKDCWCSFKQGRLIFTAFFRWSEPFRRSFVLVLSVPFIAQFSLFTENTFKSYYLFEGKNYCGNNSFFKYPFFLKHIIFASGWLPGNTITLVVVYGNSFDVRGYVGKVWSNLESFWVAKKLK